MYPHVALRCPTYRENSHANHTWHPPSRQTACFQVPEATSLWVRFPSPAPLLRQMPGHAWLQDWGQDIDPMGKSWESTPSGAVVSWPHVSLHCPEIHTYSHTQQFTKKLCDSHAPLVAIAGGWTRTLETDVAGSFREAKCSRKYSCNEREPPFRTQRHRRQVE